MRSKTTNILQVFIIITGVIYILSGLAFYFSPTKILQIFAENIPDTWLEQVKSDELLAPMYIMLQAFSAMVFTSGIAMIMPLFDPVKYRGLIYYNGLVFPFLSSFLLLRSSISAFLTKAPIGENTDEVFAANHIHTLIIIFAAVFTAIFILNLIGLIITKKDTKEEK
jgi:hypothetical protein